MINCCVHNDDDHHHCDDNDGEPQHCDDNDDDAEHHHRLGVLARVTGAVFCK